MTTTAANEYAYSLGHDFSLADALDPEFLDDEPFDPEAEAAERRTLNARMAEWYGIG